MSFRAFFFSPENLLCMAMGLAAGVAAGAMTQSPVAAGWMGFAAYVAAAATVELLRDRRMP